MYQARIVTIYVMPCTQKMLMLCRDSMFDILRYYYFVENKIKRKLSKETVNGKATRVVTEEDLHHCFEQ